MNKYKYERFDMKMSLKERQALEKLAENAGLTMSGWVKRSIRMSAKRKKLWR